MEMNQDTYVNLKILGLNTTDLIFEKMIDSPRDAARLFNACGLLLFSNLSSHNGIKGSQINHIIDYE
jgi:hypothetical protein